MRPLSVSTLVWNATAVTGDDSGVVSLSYAPAGRS
jgi:hypothetical protein